MLTTFFDRVTRASLKFYWVTLAIAVITLTIGGLALRDLNLELLPRIEFPQTVLIAQWPDAESADQFAEAVTIPLETQLSQIEGVVNVESTTSQSFAFIIVRNEFGLNQDKIVEQVKEIAENSDFPAGMEPPQVLNFSLSDLPVVTASVSSSDLSLPELKALIQDELRPDLEQLDQVSEVGVSGGQELPEEEPETVAEAPETVDPTPTSEPTATAEPTATPDPARLPDIFIQGASAAGMSLEYAQDITPDLMRQLVSFGDIATQSLALLTPDNLRNLPAETIALLPAGFLDTLDPALRAELDGLAADFGGAGALLVAETTPTEEPLAELPEVTPVELPAEWATAGASTGITLTTTADITPEVMTGIVTFAPELLNTLTPEMWRAIDPAGLTIALPVMAETLEPALMGQLQAIISAANGVAPTPVAMPQAWIAAGAYVSLTISTTADITPEFMGLVANTTPELLDSLTEDVLVAFTPETQAALPAEYVANLDPGLQQTLQVIAARYAAYQAQAGQLPEVEGVALPPEWAAAGASTGITLTTTSDLTPEVMQGIVNFAPDFLNTLTPEMWRTIAPAGLEMALPVVAETMEADLLAQLQAIVRASKGEAAEPVDLPASWVAGAAAAGMTISTTADIPAEGVAALSLAAPALLNDLTPEMILAFSPAAQAALPADYVATLDEGLQQTLQIIAIRDAQFQASQVETEEEPTTETTPEATPEPTPAPDPARLPDLLIQGAAQAGIVLEYASDITPELVQQLSAFPQGVQFLQLLTPDNLRAMQPEAIAYLPAAFLDGLDPDLRADLDTLAAEFGGAGALAVVPEEPVVDTNAPPLTGVWAEPGPDGSPPLFTTASDLLNNNFGLSAAELISFLPDSPNVENPAQFVTDLTPEVLGYLAENEEDFVSNLSPAVLQLMSPESLTFLLENYEGQLPADLIEQLQGIAAGSVEVFIPEATITRTDGDPSVLLNIYKDGDANTVTVAHAVFETLEAFQAAQADNGKTIHIALVFEQATFIEDSIEGVSREGLLGAVFAVLIILIFLSGQVGGKYRLSWRSTVVTAVSIPLSVLAAFVFMRWIPPTFGSWLNGVAESSGNSAIGFIARLFPSSVTLNIMTLSGLTVAVGRVVDDSIVVLENIYRFIQKGDDPKHAVIEGTREVAIAIFASTATTVAVFLPLGLIGGLIGSFFLPFGLTVTYALAASFVVAITVVPTLAYLLIRKEHLPEERETSLQRWYTPPLKWALAHRGLTLLLAFLLFFGSLLLLGQLPQSFIPSLGEPTINITVQLPAGTTILDTNAQVAQFENQVIELAGLESVRTEVGGGGGTAAFFGGGGVSQNQANVTVTVENQDELANITTEIRELAESQFGADNVTVSAAAQTGFGGFSIILTGDSLDALKESVETVKAALESVDVDGDGRPDITNVTSNLDAAAIGGDQTIIRIDGRPAVSFSGELETENTLGVTNAAKSTVQALDTLPAGIEVTEGFDSEQQVEGFRSMVTAIGYSIIVVYAIMALTFRSFIHPFTILFSLPFALVGAALGLFLTNSVLGISAMIGLMMLVGVVVTNAIVLMELVQQLRHEGKNAYEALVQAGRTRLRPIWMTALAAVLALIPLAASAESGAIIASELARAVIGGLLVSTALTLIVVPVVYSLIDQLGRRLSGRK